MIDINRISYDENSLDDGLWATYSTRTKKFVCGATIGDNYKLIYGTNPMEVCYFATKKNAENAIRAYGKDTKRGTKALRAVKVRLVIDE